MSVPEVLRPEDMVGNDMLTFCTNVLLAPRQLYKAWWVVVVALESVRSHCPSHSSWSFEPTQII